MKKSLVYYFIFLCLLTSCSVQRFLPPGETLYREAHVVVKRDSGVSASARSLKNMLKSATRPRHNKFLLGKPYKVWWWYVIGAPKREKGLKAFLRNRLGEPPVFGSRVNPKTTTENLQAFMENLGYFHSAVSGDTSIKGYYLEANYNARISPRYTIRNISWVKDSLPLLGLLERQQQRGSELKSGNPYQLSDIQSERNRLDLQIKKRGYYFFNPEYIMAYADSTVGNRKVDLYLNIKKETPEAAKYPYRINRITIFPNYTLVYPPPDTSRYGTEEYDRLNIRDTVKKFKPKLFTHVITYRPGQLYSSNDQNITLNRLINLGSFKFVKNRFEAVKTNDSSHLLNVYYYLTPAKRRALQAEVDAFSKENKYMGAKVSVNWKDRNAFRGAEQLNIKVYGGIETSFSAALRKNNNLRLGAEASVIVPRYFVPFFYFKENHFFLPKTRLLIGYELLTKQLFYTKNEFRFQYEFNWKESSSKEHTLAPFSISYLSAINVTDSFYKEALIRPSILLNVYSEVILGSYYTYTYNTLNPRKKNQWYFSAGADVSGNAAGLLAGAKRPREKKIFSTPFAQYFKGDIEARYKRKLTDNLTLANRLQLGFGIPYNNSALLPFSKQYIIGGASSLRGFPSRSIGPGSYLPTIEDQRFFQTIGGDFKLLGNTELRFPLSGALGAAVFVDAGNIWTKNAVLFGTAGKLKKDFLKEIAVDAGLGIRYDAQVIVIRFDVGIPLRKPFLPDGQRWVLNKIDPGNSTWRNENLILNIAIGYPF